MFYDVYAALCKSKGISLSRAADEIGLSNSTVTKWKKTGATPSGETLAKVAAISEYKKRHQELENAPEETDEQK